MLCVSVCRGRQSSTLPVAVWGLKVALGPCLVPATPVLLKGPPRSLWVLTNPVVTRPYGSSWVLIGPDEVLIGPYKSSWYVHLSPYIPPRPLKAPVGPHRHLQVLLGPYKLYKSWWVLTGPYKPLWFLISPYKSS